MEKNAQCGIPVKPYRTYLEMQLIFYGAESSPTRQLTDTFKRTSIEHIPTEPYVCVISLRGFLGYDGHSKTRRDFFTNCLGSILDKRIIADCRKFRCIIVLDDSTEAFVDKSYLQELDAFRVQHDLHKDALIFLSGQANTSSDRILSTQVFETDWIKAPFSTVVPSTMRFDKPLSYLCYNRHWNGHREIIVDELLNQNLLSFGAVSLSQDAAYYDSSVISDSLKSRLPLILDEQIGIGSENLAININTKHFHDSYISLVNETFVWDRDTNDLKIFPTEKIFKSIIMGHPFIVNAARGFLAHIRSLGYKTFSPLIDESYDDEPDYRKRIHATTRSLKQLISDMQGEQRIEIITQLYEIAAYNRQVLLDKPSNEHPLLNYANKVLK